MSSAKRLQKARLCGQRRAGKGPDAVTHEAATRAAVLRSSISWSFCFNWSFSAAFSRSAASNLAFNSATSPPAPAAAGAAAAAAFNAAFSDFNADSSASTLAKSLAPLGGAACLDDAALVSASLSCAFTRASSAATGLAPPAPGLLLADSSSDKEDRADERNSIRSSMALRHSSSGGRSSSLAAMAAFPRPTPPYTPPSGPNCRTQTPASPRAGVKHTLMGLRPPRAPRPRTRGVWRGCSPVPATAIPS